MVRCAALLLAAAAAATQCAEALSKAVVAAEPDPWTDWVADAPDAVFQPGMVTLGNGTVLLAGGGSSHADSNRTWLWDPEKNIWREGPDMLERRKNFGLVVLTDGRVMAGGGRVYCHDTIYTCPHLSNTVEILDPATAEWKRAANMTTLREGVGFAALRDGSVIAFGGSNANDQFGDGLKTAERWDPGTLQWKLLEAEMYRGVYMPTVLTLSNGSVLVIDGSNKDMSQLYNPGSKLFAGKGQGTPLAPMTVSRKGGGLVELGRGGLLAAGGFDGTNNLRSAEMYFPASNTWRRIPDMTHERPGCRATLLQNSSVLVTGASSTNHYGNTSELCNPSHLIEQWRCAESGEESGADLSCQRSSDGTGVDFKTCNRACGQPSEPHFRCVEDRCVELSGLPGTNKDACMAICGRWTNE